MLRGSSYALPLGRGRRGVCVQAWTGYINASGCAVAWGELRGPAVVESVALTHTCLTEGAPSVLVPVIWPRDIGRVVGDGVLALVRAGLVVVRTDGGVSDGVPGGLQEVQPILLHPRMYVPWPRFAPGLVCWDPVAVLGEGAAAAYSLSFV